MNLNKKILLFGVSIAIFNLILFGFPKEVNAGGGLVAKGKKIFCDNFPHWMLPWSCRAYSPPPGTPPGTPADPTCVPTNPECGNNIPIGQTCNDGCGTMLPGTMEGEGSLKWIEVTP